MILRETLLSTATTLPVGTCVVLPALYNSRDFDGDTLTPSFVNASQAKSGKDACGVIVPLIGEILDLAYKP